MYNVLCIVFYKNERQATHMKKFLIIVITLVLLAVAAYGIAYFVMPVSSMELTGYTHSVGFVSYNAYIVRDESVYYSDAEGVVYNIAADGDRVSQNTEISTVYSGNADTDALKKLNTIDSRINKLKSEVHSSKLYATDSDSSENQIAEQISELPEHAQSDNVEAVGTIKDNINGLRSGKAMSTTEQIDVLNTERARIENGISGQKHDIISDRSGIFSSYIDGLESVLVPAKIEELTPDQLLNITPDNSEYVNGKSVSSGAPICKIMNNHIWYMAGITDKNYAKQLKDQKNVTLRFTNVTDADVGAEVVFIGEPDEKDTCIFILKVNSYLESAFSYRNVNAHIIFEEYIGYKVPIDSIHTGDGMNNYYVIARAGSEAYECDVEVLYTDTNEGYSIIRAKSDAKNKLGAMDRLVTGER